MGSTIFKGSKVATLKDTLQIGKSDSDSPRILKLSTDPTSSATDATRGSMGMLYSTGEWYKKLDDGSSTNWELIGSTGGSGGINYILNPDAESGTDDTSTSANVTLARQTSGQHRGVASYDITVDSAAVAGNYAAFDMADVDAQDLGKRGYVSFDYSGDANLVNGDIEVVIRDVTGAADIAVTADSSDDGELLATGGLTTRSRFTGSFEFDDTNTTYELRIQVKSSPAANTVIRVDRLSVGPDVLVPGAIITKPVAITPNWVNLTVGNAVEDFVMWREGSILNIKGGITLGSTSSITGTLSLDMPTEMGTITMNLHGTTSSDGMGRLIDSGTTANNTTNHALAITTTRWQIGTHTGGSPVSTTVPFTWATNDRIDLNIQAEINEWSPGALLSTTEASKLTAMASGRNATGTLSATDNTIIWSLEDIDTHSAYNVSTGEFTCPRSGKYLCSGHIAINGNLASATVDTYIALKKNGALVVRDIPRSNVIHANGNITSQVTHLIECVKGDVIRFDSFTNATSPTYNGNPDQNYFSIIEEPDFSTFSVWGQTELIEVLDSSLTNYTTTAGDWGDLTSIVIPAGEWDVYMTCTWFSNGAVTTSFINLGLGTVSGNTSPGNTSEDRVNDSKTQTTQRSDTQNFIKSGLVVTNDTTYYLKARAGNSITNLQKSYRISARRIK